MTVSRTDTRWRHAKDNSCLLLRFRNSLDLGQLPAKWLFTCTCPYISWNILQRHTCSVMLHLWVFVLCNNFPLGCSIDGNFNKYYCFCDPTFIANEWRDVTHLSKIWKSLELVFGERKKESDMIINLIWTNGCQQLTLGVQCVNVKEWILQGFMFFLVLLFFSL